jgi:integrase
MSEVNSTPPAPSCKPAKPYPEYPLTPHPSRQWCKKIRGRIVYFGKWEDPDGALKKYLEQKDALHAGRKPRANLDTFTVKDAANEFLNAKQDLVNAGELSPRTFAGYKIAADELVAHMGKSRIVADLDPQDFASLRTKMARKWGPHRLGTTIQYVRSIFKHAFDDGLIPTPVRFGPGFKRPTKKTMRLHRAKQGVKLFTREEIHRLLDAAGTTLRAMLLLGINCAFGNADCGHLPLTALDLERGWVDFSRPKTGIARRCSLWPETVAALREALAKRPEPKNTEDAGLVFVTKYGFSWAKGTTTNPVSQETKKLLNALGINGRHGLGFYTLRHVFRTVGDETKDSVACDGVIGHETPHMSSAYRERISDERLRAVANHVRAWLFPEANPAE